MNTGVIISFLAAAIMIVPVGMATQNSLTSSTTIPSQYSVSTYASNGTPLDNVSVQGIMQLPPGYAGGFATVFAGTTGHSNVYSVNNTSLIYQVAQDWQQYSMVHPTAFSPYIMIQLTDQKGGNNYTSETSIDLTPDQMLKHVNYHAVDKFVFDKKHMLVTDHGVRSTNMFAVGHNIQTSIVESGTAATIQPSDISNPLPTRISDGSNYWYLENQTTLTGSTDGNYLEIPLSQATTSGYGQVEAGATMIETSVDYSGLVTNPYSTTSNQVTIGSSNGQNSNSYTADFMDPNAQTYSSTAYILGYVQVANYQLYQYNSYDAYMCGRFGLDCNQIYTPTGQYETITAITDIATSGSNILHGVNEGTTPLYQNEMNNHFALNQVSNLPDTFTSGGQTWYTYSSTDLYSNVVNYAALAGVGVALGAILLTLATAGTVDAAIIAGISTGALGVLLGYINWGSSTSSAVLSTVQYSTTDGQTPILYFDYTDQNLNVNGNLIQVPIEYSYVIGPAPPSSGGGGGGGGCVLYGTLISLANGTQMPVQDLSIGMQIYSYDTTTHKITVTSVSNITETNVSMIMDINNGQLYVSGLYDQPIYAKAPHGGPGWITVGALRDDMQIFEPLNNTWVTITNVSLQFGHYSVFDVQSEPGFRQGNIIRSDYMGNGILLDMKIGA